MKLTIRIYRHLDALLKDALLKSDYPFSISRTPLEQLLNALFLKEKLFVALVNNQLAGTLTVRYYTQKIWEIRYVYTTPSYRRRHIASSLISCTIDFLKQAGAKKVILDVLYDNEPAKKLYRKLGFNVLTPFFYGEGPLGRLELEKKIHLEQSNEKMFRKTCISCIEDSLKSFFDVNDRISWLTFVNRFDPLFFRQIPRLTLFRDIFLIGKKANEAFGFTIIKRSFRRKVPPLLILFALNKNEKKVPELLFGSVQKILVENGYKRARLLIFDKDIDYYYDFINLLKSKGWNILFEYCMGLNIG
jgi:ribosomal protein S18 acetylase RimI-like enzyme